MKIEEGAYQREKDHKDDVAMAISFLQELIDEHCTAVWLCNEDRIARIEAELLRMHAAALLDPPGCVSP
jgi:hypothetical protein